MASQQRRRLPHPDTNSYTDRNGDSYGYIYADKPDANGYSYGNHHTTSISYAYSYCNGDIHAEADANAKAAAHAVSSADAVRMG
jgi:hypothetical protein